MPRFAIAGGGIAGLATALALGRDGHAVTVLDRRAQPGEVGAGLQLSPNATRLLDGWGLLPALEAVSTEPGAVDIRRGRDAAVLASVPLGRAARDRYGAPALVLHRGDLHDVLARAVATYAAVRLKAGVTVPADPSFGGLPPSPLGGEGGSRRRRETDERSTPPGRVLRDPSSAPLGHLLPQGEKGDACAIDADGLIRADGVHAPALDGSRPVFSGKIAWRALVPAHGLPPDLTRPRTTVWLGPRAHLVHYPLRHGTLINIVVVTEGSAGGTGDDDAFWSRPGDPDRLAEHLRGWHPLPLGLLARVTEWRTWPLLHRLAPHPWSQGRQTTVGDAAHPMLPFLAQGASQSIEDAAVLARAVGASPDDIPAAFARYERSRAQRALTVTRRSERQGRIYHLGGPAAATRDFALKALGARRLLAGMDWLYGPARP